jgi:hypothetical protein
MVDCLGLVKKMRLIDGVFTVTLLGSLNIIKMGNNMKKFLIQTVGFGIGWGIALILYYGIEALLKGVI